MEVIILFLTNNKLTNNLILIKKKLKIWMIKIMGMIIYVKLENKNKVIILKN